MAVKENSLSLKVFTFVNESVIKNIFHEIFFRHPPVMRLLWGVKVPPLMRKVSFGHSYTDLSGFLLRGVLARWVKSGGLRRVHEIGIGQFGIMCVHMQKRFPQLSISGSTVSQTEIENSTKATKLNGLQFPFYISDVLADFKGDPVEMIWWNLPYYDPHMLDYLRRLFQQVGQNKALVDGGLIVLATNQVPLSAETIISLAEKFSYLRILEVKRHVWNPHAVVTLEYRAKK